MGLPKTDWHRLAALLVTGALLIGPVFAAQPDAPGKPDKAAKEARSPEAKKQSSSSSANVDVSFGERERDLIPDYYGHEFEGGHCPPGLAKKQNGCLPPGQAKKWRVGYPLPHDVIYYDLPDELLKRLGQTPEGYKLVRVGVDILEIVVGTGLVVEAVEDLGGLF